MPYNLRKRKPREEAEEAPPTAPKVTKVAPKATKAPPKAIKPPSKPEKAAQEVDNATPKAEKAVLKAASKAEKATSKAEKAASKAEKAASKAEKDAPKSEKDPLTDVKAPLADVKTPPPAEEALPTDAKANTTAEEAPLTDVDAPPKKKKKTIGVPICNQYVFGHDSCGELGFQRIGFARKQPTQAKLDEHIKQVCCGPMHTLSLTISGQVFTYGCNDEGALGRVTDGDETLEATPTIVPLDAKVTKVTAGDSHSAALTEDNRVYIWGNFRDEHGSVGLLVQCNGEASHQPIQVLPNVKLTDIASGSNHMLLLDEDGTVYSFGVGTQGQLGRLKPEEIVDDQGDKINNEKKRNLFLTPKPVSLKNVDPSRPFVCDAIFAGNFSSFATNTDKKKNRLAAWGLNNYFQLGLKGQKGQLVQYFPKRSTFTCSTSMINVACGPHHTLFLTRTGRVYAAGRQNYGMLGMGNVSKEVCPAKYVEFPSNSQGVIRTICAGINTSFAVNESGKLYSWGMSGLNLGIEGEEDVMVPTEVEKLADHHITSVSTGGSFTAVLVKP